MTEAEQAVIGCMLMDPAGTASVFSRIDARMFEAQPLGLIYSCCYRLHKAGIPYDVVTVLSKLGDDYKVLIATCAQTAPSISRLDYYADCVLEGWRQRTLETELSLLLSERPDSKETLRRLHEIASRQEKIQAYIEDENSKDFLRGATEFCTELSQPDTSIKTGWADFDRIVGGLQRKSVYVIAARPGKGKTDWALQMACRLSREKSVLYCTMEMPTTQLMQRIASRCSKINSIKLRDRQLTEDERRTVFGVMDQLAKMNKMRFDETAALTSSQVEEKILRYQPDVLFIDHLGLMDKGDKRNPWDAVADNCHRLKTLAMQHDIAIVELVQLSRETDHRKASQGDLYGGSAVEQDADAVFALEVEPIEKFLENDESVGVTVNILKNRHGGVGELKYRWQPQYHLYAPEEGRFE